MRLLASTAVVLALAGALGGCITQKTYLTELDVCSSGNGTVKSAKVTKSSGDPVIDKHAVEQVGKQLVYTPTEQLTCKPLTVEYRVTGEQAP
jgi:Gram-negative bacterial TonB protein C-terminal